MALSEAFGRSLSPAEAKCFAERLLAGLEHMYNKRRQATSGAKLQAPVLGLAKAISSSSMVAAAAPIEGPKKDLTSLSPSQILYMRGSCPRCQKQNRLQPQVMRHVPRPGHLCGIF